MSKRTPKELRHQERQAGEKLTAHRGMATWGEKLVPLGNFKAVTAASGRRLPQSERQSEIANHLAAVKDDTPVEGPYRRVAVFGGVYNNRVGLESLLEDARQRGAEAVYCLGDLGGFGPNPEKVWPLIQADNIRAIQGNYEESLAAGREDCNCGYTDPQDNHFARLSYDYTAAGCSPQFKEWMGALPLRRRILLGDREVLLVHGSPRQINEFLFESTSPDPFLERALDREDCDGILCTHSGLHWHRRLDSGRDVVNVGVIGRPANDGETNVWYCMLEDRGGALGVALVPFSYDYEALAAEMRLEDLPEEFVETILTGWWTTCLEVLPAKERARSKF
jgi:hypothetical protein